MDPGSFLSFQFSYVLLLKCHILFSIFMWSRWKRSLSAWVRSALLVELDGPSMGPVVLLVSRWICLL